MSNEKTYSLDSLPVGTMNSDTSDHRVLVNDADASAGFLFEKQASNSQIGFVSDPKNEGKFIVLLDSQHPDSDTQGTNLLRTISTFGLQEANSSYINLNGSQESSRIILFPLTISIGEIKGLSIFTIHSTDIDYIDRLQVAILSNTVNDLAGSKVEFFGQYGYGDENDNLVYTGDGKQFSVLNESAHCSIDDLDCMFHFVALFVHVRTDAPSASSIGLMAKSKSNSPLVEIGKNMNYCGEDNNEKTLLRSGFIDTDTFTVKSSYSLQTNLQHDFPYLEFYQVRGW